MHLKAFLILKKKKKKKEKKKKGEREALLQIFLNSGVCNRCPNPQNKCSFILLTSLFQPLDQDQQNGKQTSI